MYSPKKDYIDDSKDILAEIQELKKHISHQSSESENELHQLEILYIYIYEIHLQKIKIQIIQCKSKEKHFLPIKLSNRALNIIQNLESCILQMIDRPQKQISNKRGAGH